MLYKLIKEPARDLPHAVFPEKKKNNFNPPSEEIQRIYNKYKKEKQFVNRAQMHQLIDFYKESIKRNIDWNGFNFEFSFTKEYNDIQEFYNEVKRQSYKIDFDKIKSSYIEDKIKKGELFLFKIYNKDFSPHSKGSPNLHTSFWRLLFDEKNLKDTVAKLDGQAEIFFRPASIKKSERKIHKKDVPIENKNLNNAKKESKFKYDLIKDRRYTQDKFLFHVPITLNFSTQNKTAKQFNTEVNHFLQHNTNVNIIGIDRGERNLLYYTVIDQEGKILEQESLNIIANRIPNQNNIIETDYHSILDKKEHERDRARKDWGTIENIKELKAGYLSQVVHKLTNLIIKYNAIVMLEDLNIGFKRGRFKVEKQVYQKFEKALIDKLNYLVFKDRNWGEAGHYLNAYQLTPPTPKRTKNQKLDKQKGILFYVRAAYTSKIDPATGFVPPLRLRYESVEKSIELLECFSKIRYNSEKLYFEFTFDDKNEKFKDTQMPSGGWTVCTHGKERYSYNRETKETKPYNITDKIKKLLNQNEISYEEGKDLRSSFSKKLGKEFYRKLFRYMNITLQLRYTFKKGDEEEDFILSPVKNEQGVFFDSRKVKKDNSMPKDADANGAYHIALKGLWILEKINTTLGKDSKAKLTPSDLILKDKCWIKFAQDRIQKK